MPVWVTEEQAPAVLRHALHVFREDGSREKRDKARLRYLIEQIGVDEFLARVEARLGYRARADATRPSRRSRSTRTSSAGSARSRTGLWALGVSIPLGRMTHEQLDGLADLAEQHGDGTLRTAYDQGIVVPNIATGRAGRGRARAEPPGAGARGRQDHAQHHRLHGAAVLQHRRQRDEGARLRPDGHAPGQGGEAGRDQDQHERLPQLVCRRPTRATSG